MSDSFEAEVMDELYDTAEGPAQRRDPFEEEEFDALEEEFEGFEDEFEEGSEEGFEEMEDYGEEMDVDSWEDAVADAMDEEDTDEFFRRVRRAARRVARGVARVAPIVSRVARLIPHPAAQAVARAAALAGRAGRALSADEMDTLEDLYDFAEDEDSIDAAAPLIAGLAVRRVAPAIARAPQAVRRQIVRSVSQATRGLARRLGPQGPRAVPRLLQGAFRVLRRRRLPLRALAPGLRRIAAGVVRNPRIVRQLARPMARAAARGMRPRMRPRMRAQR